MPIGKADVMRKVLLSIVLTLSFVTLAALLENPLSAQVLTSSKTTQSQDIFILAGGGCCSHHSGVCGCENGRTVCCDGSLSPSCTCNSSNEKPPKAKPESSPAPVSSPVPSPSPVQSTNYPVTVYFSPGGQCTEAIVKEIDKARTSILVQAYSFTSAPIAKALMEARKRGIMVQVILDKSNKTDKYSSADFLLHADIPTKIDSAHAIAHNKIIILDGETVITGSFNFTKAAEERNAENLIVIHDKGLAGKYTENWKAHEKHSEVYSGKNR